MLASPQKMIDRITFPAFAQTKMDGMRALIFIDRGVVTVFSRNGNVMLGLGDHFKPMVQHDNMVYDGELTIVKNGVTMSRKMGNGICHKAVVGTISPQEIAEIRITLWDIIPLSSYKSGKDPTPYYLRLDELRSITPHELFNIVDTHTVNDLSHAYEIYQEKITRGEEGIILKNQEHPWEDKRSTQVVKMKETLEIDLRVVSFQEGEGKNLGKLGALICENETGDIRVSVGTGFSDEDRVKFTSQYSLGKVISIKYNGMINRKSDSIKSLFLPVFVEFRIDKNKSD